MYHDNHDENCVCGLGDSLIEEFNKVIRDTQIREGLSGKQTANLLMGALLVMMGSLIRISNNPLLYYQKVQETLATYVIDD